MGWQWWLAFAAMSIVVFCFGFIVALLWADRRPRY